MATVWQMQFDTTEEPEYYRHLSELAQSEPRLVAQASEWIALAQVFQVLGTSSVDHPAVGLPRIALERGARALEINLRPTELSLVTRISLRGKCEEVLPQMIAQANEHEN